MNSLLSGLAKFAKDLDNVFMDKIKMCKHHGETWFALRPKYGTYVCKKCRTVWTQRRKKNIKLILIEEFGGKCILCGYMKCHRALHFHHLDSSKKEFGIGDHTHRAIEYIRQEAKKCVLLCSNCHNEVEAGVTELPARLTDNDLLS